MNIGKRLMAWTWVLLFFVLLSSCSLAVEKQYKKISREAMSKIVDGKIDKAIKDMIQARKELPGDLESLYVLAVASAQKGDMDQAFAYAQKAIDGGLPIERFYTCVE